MEIRIRDRSCNNFRRVTMSDYESNATFYQCIIINSVGKRVSHYHASSYKRDYFLICEMRTQHFYLSWQIF